MTKSRISLSSSTYKSGIFEGFIRLQQSDEFVDMTLAADGHLVKVHQTLVALASPYLKHMLLAVPCKHPVIFLNGISHEMLSLILEYIYRGEVEIPAEKVQSFINAAQAMHIAGLKNIIPSAGSVHQKEKRNLFINVMETDNPVPLFIFDTKILLKDYENLGQEKQTKHVFFKPEKPPPAAKPSFTLQNDQLLEPIIELSDNDTEHQTDLPCNIDIPTTSAFERNYEHENLGNMNTCGKSINISYNNCVSDANISQKPVANIEILSNTLTNENIDAMKYQGQLPQLYTEALANMKKIIEENNISNQVSVQQCNPESEPAGSDNVNNNGETNETGGKDNETDSIQYTVSNRGALQLIFNRFMYYCHYGYQRDNGRKRRWRCIDYRDSHCPASIDTLDENIVDRKHKHCHPNHDQKIRKKMVKGGSKIFSTVQMAQDNMKKQFN